MDEGNPPSGLTKPSQWMKETTSPVLVASIPDKVQSMGWGYRRTRASDKVA